MSARFRTQISLLLALVLLAGAPAIAAPQRARRPSRNIDSAPSLPSGASTVPAGTVLAVSVETRLDSGSVRPSDRFTTRVRESLFDRSGRELIPAGSIIDGYVQTVTRAQRGRRPGLISVAFDRLRLTDGRILPLDGTLTAADAKDRRRLDEEGNLKGGSTTAQTIVFIGGGAGTGALVGAIAGGAMWGAGIGAAAGAVGALLARGREAVVEPGTRISVKLNAPLNLDPGVSGIRRIDPSAQPPASPPPAEPEENRGRVELKRSSPDPRGSAPPPAGVVTVKLSDVRVERGENGMVRVLLTAETPSAGWRIYADQTIDRDTLEVWLRGDSPRAATAQVISHPTVTLEVADGAGAIRQVIVHAANGDRRVALEAAGLPVPARRDLSARVADKTEVLLADYGAQLGTRRGADGRVVLGESGEAEKDLLAAIARLKEAAGALNQLIETEAEASAQRRATERLAASAREVRQLWDGARHSSDLDRKWRALEDEISLLVAAGN